MTQRMPNLVTNIYARSQDPELDWADAAAGAAVQQQAGINRITDCSSIMWKYPTLIGSPYCLIYRQPNDTYTLPCHTYTTGHQFDNFVNIFTVLPCGNLRLWKWGLIDMIQSGILII